MVGLCRSVVAYLTSEDDVSKAAVTGWQPVSAGRRETFQIEPPEKVRFIGDIKGEIKAQLKITNKSDTKQAFKVKCTRNDIFKIRPATGILDYNQSAVISIVYQYVLLSSSILVSFSAMEEASSWTRRSCTSASTISRPPKGVRVRAPGPSTTGPPRGSSV